MQYDAGTSKISTSKRPMNYGSDRTMFCGKNMFDAGSHFDQFGSYYDFHEHMDGGIVCTDNRSNRTDGW